MARIYVALRNERTSCWRPVNANKVVEDLCRTNTGQKCDREDEEWEFPPGSLVRCELKTLSGGNSELVAVALAAD